MVDRNCNHKDGYLCKRSKDMFLALDWFVLFVYLFEGDRQLKVKCCI